jgi:hypothetical protein
MFPFNKTFTVLRLDFWAGRLSMSYAGGKNGKIFREPYKIEMIICGIFNYLVCIFLGHKRCDIEGCNCKGTICIYCGKDLK